MQYVTDIESWSAETSVLMGQRCRVSQVGCRRLAGSCEPSGPEGSCPTNTMSPEKETEGCKNAGGSVARGSASGTRHSYSGCSMWSGFDAAPSGRGKEARPRNPTLSVLGKYVYIPGCRAAQDLAREQRRHHQLGR